MDGYLDLYDFRTRVAAMYQRRNAAITEGQNQAEILKEFRARRDEIFRSHPQSALDATQKASFQGLEYFPYDPAARVEAIIDTEVEPVRIDVPIGDGEVVPLAGAAVAHFSYQGQAASLSLFWIDVYGGGLFLPFRDATAPRETYGGGRYLFDTVKGSDFQWVSEAEKGHRVFLDFNYAYNPSCAYNPRWVCPLAPHVNHLPFSIRAGERIYAQ